MVRCSFWLPVFARRSGATGPDAASGVSPEGETANTESGSGRTVDAARRPAMMAASYGRENRPVVGTMDGNEAGEDFIRSPSMCCWLEWGEPLARLSWVRAKKECRRLWLRLGRRYCGCRESGFDGR